MVVQHWIDIGPAVVVVHYDQLQLVLVPFVLIYIVEVHMVLDSVSFSGASIKLLFNEIAAKFLSSSLKIPFSDVVPRANHFSCTC